jgi:S-adenosyl-L-methionine hydrolase (adenosine-forming)
MTTPLLTLTTDFGTRDPWVASLKATLWSLQADIQICDITHEVPKYDVVAGAFALHRCYRDFPPRTIHMGVVDPGVGGPRRPILVVSEDHIFIGPDNGIFSYVYERDVVHRVIHLTAEHHFRRPISDTFHARDIFAPVAAQVIRGIDPLKFGDVITDYVKISVPLDAIVGDALVKGEVCAVDRFGNLVTNIHQDTLRALAEKTGKGSFKVLLAGHELPILTGGYVQKVPLFALVGSFGFLEISANQRSAAEALGITSRGKEVGVMPE